MLGCTKMMVPSSVETARTFYQHLGPDRLAARTTPEWDHQITQALLDMLRPGQRILDAGCGYGRIAIPLSAAGYEVIGVDISEAMLTEARRRADAQHLELALLNESMCDLSLPSGQVDVALCLWSAFYELLTEEEQLSAVLEIHRVLRPGGWALLEGPVYTNATPEEIATQKRRGVGNRLSVDVIEGLTNPHFRHDEATLRALMERAGISSCRIHTQDWAGRTRQFLRFEKTQRDNAV
jgi:ubiquinone/menaquinone biosynthesis C-methylase UbiE